MTWSERHNTHMREGLEQEVEKAFRLKGFITLLLFAAWGGGKHLRAIRKAFAVPEYQEWKASLHRF